MPLIFPSFANFYECSNWSSVTAYEEEICQYSNIRTRIFFSKSACMYTYSISACFYQLIHTVIAVCLIKLWQLNFNICQTSIYDQDHFCHKYISHLPEIEDKKAFLEWGLSLNDARVFVLCIVVNTLPVPVTAKERYSVLWIRIRAYVFGPPGSGSVSQRYWSGSGFYHQAKILRKTLIPTVL